MCGRCANPKYRDHDACARLPEASVPRLRKFLLPVELAEAELKAKPAAAVMILLREGPRGLEVLFGERRKRGGARSYGAPRAGQQTGDARRPVRGPGHRAGRGGSGPRDGVRLLGDAPRPAADARVDPGPDDFGGAPGALVHLRRGALLGV